MLPCHNKIKHAIVNIRSLLSNLSSRILQQTFLLSHNYVHKVNYIHTMYASNIYNNYAFQTVITICPYSVTKHQNKTTNIQIRSIVFNQLEKDVKHANAFSHFETKVIVLNHTKVKCPLVRVAEG